MSTIAAHDADGSHVTDEASTGPDGAAPCEPSDAQEPAERSWVTAAMVGAGVTLAVVAVFRMETSVADYDPQYMRVLVERTVAQGGSWYQNGVHNKGPLEPAIYEVAARLGGRDGFWLVIAVFALIAAAAAGAACVAVARRFGARPGIALAAFAVAVVHLTLSSSDYAGVLYSRNIVVALLAVAFAVGITDEAWSSPRRRGVAVAAIGLAVGLAVQTTLTTAFAGGALLVWLMILRRGERVAGRPVPVVLPAVAAVAFFSAPLYYRVLGPWDDFVSGWWTYARFMSTATGRSLGNQFGLGWDQFVAYHGERPEQVVLLVAFVVTSGVRWRSSSTGDRIVRAALATWWVLAWIELVLSQRYSSHYFSILAVPLLLMLAAVLADLSRAVPASRWRGDLARVAVVGSVVVALVVGDLDNVRAGASAASRYDDVHDLGERRSAALGGRRVMTGALLDLVGAPGDPMLMWTSYPWPYLEYDRVSATRYIWSTFMLGQIYLARSGPEYVLAGTWDNFADDLERTDPTAFVVESVNPVVPGTPFAAAVDERFTTVYDDEEITVALRNDLADELTSSPVDAEPVELDDPTLGPLAPSTWSTRGCVRLDAVLDVPAGAVAVTVAVPTSGWSAVPAVTVRRDELGARSAQSATPGRGTFDVALGASGATEWSLTVVAGDRSAVVLVDGQVAGAVELDALPPGWSRETSRRVEVTAPVGAPVVASLVRSAPPDESGCSS